MERSPFTGENGTRDALFIIANCLKAKRQLKEPERGVWGIAGNQVICSNIYDEDWRTASLRYISAVLVNTLNINA